MLFTKKSLRNLATNCSFVKQKSFLKMFVYVFAGLLVFLSSCNSQKQLEKTARVKIIFDESKSEEVKLSEFADKKKCKLISLETRKEALIVEITKLWLTDSLIIIYDQINSQILLFDNSGSFIRNIGSKGKGPGEYIAITNANFYPESNEIEIFDLVQMKMICYDIAGKLVFDKRSSIYFTNFYRVDDGYWVYGPFENGSKDIYNLHFATKDLKEIEESYFPTEINFDSRKTQNFAINSRKELYFQYGYNNTIFKLENKTTVTPYYKIDAGNYNVPYQDVCLMRNRTEIEQTLFFGKKYFGGIDNFQVGDDIIYFQINQLSRTPVTTHGIFLRTKNNDYKIYDRFNSELAGIIVFSPQCLYDNKVVFTIYPAKLSDNDMLIMKNLTKKDLTLESNPILFIANEKKF